MFKLKLISANINSNYLEKPDRLYLTVKLQNIGDSVCPRKARIAADVIFCGRHRREQDQANEFRFTWEPMPALNNFGEGEVWSTTGVWPVHSFWGASFDVRISVIGENGEVIPFIGENGKEVYCQSVGEVDFGWGWGRGRLLEQRKPICKVFNAVENIKTAATQSTVKFNDFLMGAEYPQFLGYKDELWTAVSPVLTERRISDNTTKTYPVSAITSKLLSADNDKITYRVKTDNVSADVFVKKCEKNFLLGIENVEQKADYELINIEFPVVAESKADDAIMTNYFGGGRLLELKDALPQSIPFIFDTCNTFLVGNKESGFCVNATDADNIMIQSILMGADDIKVGAVGTKLVVNHPANKEGMKSIPVDTVPVEIHVLKDTSWKSSAFILRDSLPESKRRYEGVSFVKTALDASNQYNPENPATYASRAINTLDDIDEYATKIANATDKADQVIYIVGWQVGGHDFEYPYPYKKGMNPLVGTIEQYREIADRHLKENNIALSFHDNFDDAYLSENYDLGDNLIALDEKGDFYKGWLWAGGMSYIVSPTKYINSKELDERISETVKLFDLSKLGTYHLDVMTSENRRYDFTQSNPSSAQQNLEAKLKIVEKFNEYGVDITSETLAMPYLTHIGYSNGPRLRKTGEVFCGDRFMPLTTIAMHGVVPYPTNINSDEETLFAFVYGYSNAFLNSAGEKIQCTHKELIHKYYIYSVPMLHFVYKKVVDMEYSKESAEIFYEDNSRIKVDFLNNKYEIVLNGKKIAWDYNTFAPRGDNYYLYSRAGIEGEFELPADWSETAVYVVGESGREEIGAVKTEGGKFTFKAEAETAYVFVKK